MSVWMTLVVWQKDSRTPGRIPFVLMGLSGVLWCLGDLLELRGVFSEWVTDRIKYAGILALPGLWLSVAAHAARLDIATRLPWLPALLVAPNAVSYALMWSPQWSPLFSTTLVGATDHHGPLWWVQAVYGWILISCGALLVLASGLRRRPIGWSRLLLGLATLVPLVGNGFYIAQGTVGLDPTPVLLIFGLLGLQAATFSGGLLQLLPVSQLELVGQLPYAVVVTDRQATVVSLNRLAERRLGVTSRHAEGRSLDALMSRLSPPVPFAVTPLRALDREVGSIVTLDPPAKRGSAAGGPAPAA